MSQQRTHTGGLYCTEGSQHVSRPSVRVHHPPGGNNSWNFLQGNNPSAAAQESHLPSYSSAPVSNSYVPAPIPSRRNKDNEITGKIGQPSKSVQRDNDIPNGTPSYNPITDDTTYYSGQQESLGEDASVEQVSANGGLAPVFCVEGSQVRSRPAVRIVGEQRRNYDIISG